MASYSFLNEGERKCTLLKKIITQWEFRNNFKEHPITTDPLTIQSWACQILSTEIFDIEELEKECGELKKKSVELLEEKTIKLKKSLENVKLLLETLLKLTDTYIPLEDQRFTPTTRWEQNNARNIFKQHSHLVGGYITKIDEILVSPDEKKLEDLQKYLETLPEEAKLILVINYATDDLTTIIKEFHKAVEGNEAFEKHSECERLHNELSRKKHAKFTKEHCLSMLPIIVSKCDLYYASVRP